LEIVEEIFLNGPEELDHVEASFRRLEVSSSKIEQGEPSHYWLVRGTPVMVTPTDAIRTCLWLCRARSSESAPGSSLWRSIDVLDRFVLESGEKFDQLFFYGSNAKASNA
jgi:hypothetical protein